MTSNQDPPWSSQDVRQIRGRAHRQPQKKEVEVIHILAEDSSDVLVHSMAHGKQDMFEAFLERPAGRGKQ
jgi:TATA-binding protein-associated factor